MGIAENILTVKKTIQDGVELIAISKTKSAREIMEAYQAGQRHFGENKAQELSGKFEELPKDIVWHMVGHLQTNKVKTIAPFVSLIHSVDSMKLLRVIEKEGRKNQRVVPCLLQLHIAEEDTKFGLSLEECIEILQGEDFRNMKHTEIKGVMGMATFTTNQDQVKREFRELNRSFHLLKEKFFSAQPSFREISMGMSDDYSIAMEEGSTMVRVGSAIFGRRNYG